MATSSVPDAPRHDAHAAHPAPDIPRPRRLLAAGSGLVAASAYLGTLGLAGVKGAAGRRLDAQLPFGSRRLACAALVAVVAVPHTVAAWCAWRGDRRTDPAATAAGGLLVGWIGVQKVVLEDSSFLQPAYAGIGALMLVAGRRWWAARLLPADQAIEGEIEILCPPEVVFDTVADERNEPSYNPRLHSVEKTTSGPLGAGTRFRARAGGRGRDGGLPMTVELTEYTRPHRLASTSHLKAMDVAGSITFDPTEQGTRMRWSWRLEPHGALARVQPLVCWLGRRQETRVWQGLKRYLED